MLFRSSRQTFYNLLAKFVRDGTAGLLPDIPGPRGPFKLTAEIVTFVQNQLQHEPEVFGSVLADRIQERFGLSIHKRTIERLLGDLRIKKNP